MTKLGIGQGVPRWEDPRLLRGGGRYTDDIDPVKPLGIKGVGERGCVGALPALMNAVGDALRPLGVTRFGMPATPFRVWRAIHRESRA